ncbi:energy transducer TonB [Thermochromatium tepidum]|uniref:TonB family protein n=1 Tax=Thermochromatium tepidum ATCC 43061 TaxID=316276 RepID=A0A6I6EFW6_THETI|nr:energy transducer TonB [Thermochromatium tepidum]QGU32237.1 TonB family protein [Thermochromatium tepidum ATCC 43061]
MMEIRVHHWLIALMVAGAAHVALLLAWPTPSCPKSQVGPVYSLRLAASKPSKGADLDEPSKGHDKQEPRAPDQPTLTPPPSKPMPKAAIQTPLSAPTTPKTQTPESRVAKSGEGTKTRTREGPKRLVETRQGRPRPVTTKTPAPTRPMAGVEASPEIPSTQAQRTQGGTEERFNRAGHGGSGQGADDGGVGTGVDPADIHSYYATLVAWLKRHRRYPESARRRQEQGTVQVTFSIDRQGRLLSHRIESSSGHPVLDQEARSLLQRASPMPPIPANLAQNTLTVTIPISFSLH